jgi:hypothetical protein
MLINGSLRDLYLLSLIVARLSNDRAATVTVNDLSVIVVPN